MVDIVYIVIVIGAVLISMTFHEAMHGFASYWLGDDTARLQGRLSLNPLKHIDPFLTILLPIMLAVAGLPIFGGAKPVPFNPQNLRYDEWGVAIVALAGPLTNLLLAFVTFGLWVVFGASGQTILGQVLMIIVMVNLGFFIFNMVPVPPLDGSRVMYALAPEFVKRGMEAMEKYGIIVVFAIILLIGNELGTLIVGAVDFFLNLFGKFFGL
jgi:Zn-dependent protease